MTRHQVLSLARLAGLQIPDTAEAIKLGLLVALVEKLIREECAAISEASGRHQQSKGRLQARAVAERIAYEIRTGGNTL